MKHTGWLFRRKVRWYLRQRRWLRDQFGIWRRVWAWNGHRSRVRKGTVLNRCEDAGRWSIAPAPLVWSPEEEAKLRALWVRAVVGADG